MKDLHRLLRLPGLLLALVATALLAGCGGGGSGGGLAGAGLEGTAAVGAPVDGILYVTDSNGVEVNVPIEPDGSFSVSVEGMTPPFMLRVIPNGGGDVLYSFAAEEGTTVNVTPLTTLALYLAYDGDLDALYAAWSANTSALDDLLIADQQEIINANLSALFDAFTVDATFYNFVNVEFDTDSTGIDGVLDSLDISIDYAGDTFTVLVDGNPYVWDPNIDTSGIDIGDFALTEGSTWQLTVTDLINDVTVTELIPWTGVPNDLDQFEAQGITDLMADFVVEGLEISLAITELEYDVIGSGELGTIISGEIIGTVTISGEFDGLPINETVELETLFEWERVDTPIT